STQVTYHRDVARILQQNCVQCHHDKGIAPLALDEIADVTDRAKTIRRVIEDRAMPPWSAAPLAEGQPHPAATDHSLSTREEGDSGYWGAYVPGNSGRIYPDGFARKLPAGATISFQIHYTPNGKATQDQLRMGLVFAKQPPRFAMHTAAVANPKLSIPPGEANHVETAEKPVPFDMPVTALLAHMHVRGKAFKFEVTYPDGKSETLLDIPRYD